VSLDAALAQSIATVNQGYATVRDYCAPEAHALLTALHVHHLAMIQDIADFPQLAQAALAAALRQVSPTSSS